LPGFARAPARVARQPAQLGQQVAPALSQQPAQTQRATESKEFFRCVGWRHVGRVGQIAPEASLVAQVGHGLRQLDIAARPG